VSAGGLLRTARDGAARRARMTGEDAVQLADVFWQVARRQAKDTLHGLLARARRGSGSDGATPREPPL
jgi:hypothetical protein